MDFNCLGLCYILVEISYHVVFTFFLLQNICCYCICRFNCSFFIFIYLFYLKHLDSCPFYIKLCAQSTIKTTSNTKQNDRVTLRPTVKIFNDMDLFLERKTYCIYKQVKEFSTSPDKTH